MGSFGDCAFAAAIILCAFLLLFVSCAPPLVKVYLPAARINGTTITPYVMVNPSDIKPPPVIDLTDDQSDTSMSFNLPTNLNCLWCKVGDAPANVVSRANAGNIRNLYVQVGNWNTDSNGNIILGAPIAKWVSDGAVQAWMASIRALDSTLKIYAWVIALSEFNVPEIPPNIDDSSNRNTMASAAAIYVNSNGFDGFHDDTESKQGTNYNLSVLWNNMGAVQHANGKLFSCATMIYSDYQYTDIYPNLNASHIDLVNPMLYDYAGYDEEYIMAYTDIVCNLCPCKVAVGLMVEPEGEGRNTFSEQLEALSDLLAIRSYSNLYGVALWEYDVILNADWTTWNNWIGEVEPPPASPNPLAYAILSLMRH